MTVPAASDRMTVRGLLPGSCVAKHLPRLETCFKPMTTDPTHAATHDTSADIEDRVLKVIATTKRLPRESVTLDSSFESLGVDSLDRLNILFDLESEFDIQINDEDAKRVENIPQMITGVEQLVLAKAESPAHPERVVVPASKIADRVTPEQAAAAQESTSNSEPIATKPPPAGA